jgi:hypothetical protein
VLIQTRNFPALSDLTGQAQIQRFNGSIEIIQLPLAETRKDAILRALTAPQE